MHGTCRNPFSTCRSWGHTLHDAHNDFVIKFANVNGSGSASANGMFAKAVFRMGVPVGTRNIFPSNIQGLPTWFEVRVNEAGYLGRRDGVDIMVAMNAETYAEDVASHGAGWISPLRQLATAPARAHSQRCRRHRRADLDAAAV